MSDEIIQGPLSRAIRIELEPVIPAGRPGETLVYLRLQLLTPEAEEPEIECTMTVPVATRLQLQLSGLLHDIASVPN